MSYDYGTSIVQAENNFSRARNRTFWTNIWARLRGQSTELLSFNEVRQKLRLSDERNLGLQDIPLDAIVGSVGRYKDFNRKFLPTNKVNKDRWKTVDTLLMGATGLPPIDVYKVGEAYFVIDGNHRVSVARAEGLPTIEAYVTEFKTDVPFDADTKPQELFEKEMYAQFLRETSIKTLRPDSHVYLTEAGNYPAVLNHIEVHHYFMGLECECPVSWEDAVASWYDNLYTPMVNMIREHEMLKGFSDRTEADLYVWLIWHQESLQETYQAEIGEISIEETVDNFIEVKKLKRA